MVPSVVGYTVGKYFGNHVGLGEQNQETNNLFDHSGVGIDYISLSELRVRV